MPKLRVRSILKFDCPHSTIIDGSELLDRDQYCRACNRMVRVVSVAFETRVTCKTCRYSRGFGQNRLQAIHAFHRHAGRYTYHWVFLYRGRQILVEKRPRNDREIPF